MCKLLTRLTAAGLLSAALLSPAQAAEFTIRLGHLWPAVSGPHKNLIQPWADKIEAESGGRISVEVYPSGTLAKPPAQYDAVKNGIMDVTATVQGYSANRFPLTQIVELPGVAKDAVNGSCILQSLLDEKLISEEYEDTKPIFLYTHGPGLLHTRDKLIKVPSDLSGLRIRRPTTVVAELLTELNAQPVGMPAPGSYTAMQRGVIDGVAFPWEAMASFRLNELTNTHTEVGGLYTISFIVTMNKRVYNSLPADLQAIIDKNSGLTWAEKAGEVFDALDVVGKKQAKDAGHEIFTIEGGVNNPDWKPLLDKASQNYIDSLEAKGLPAKKVYTRARELATSCPS
ncbi:TRAP-type C4-dicarboxylate transport system, substrate-binding protein [Amphritea atlantica]|uniref:TRAP-type C4-dicarboxylate transport system, substrate-binding protein n=1 Tax=Amphritea atlantica TaxID=355243 RepID=A0A1H9FDW7_9GAMM|nr:TRAP transporter substrate-binding protein [Amphritea atlantica]SEQ36126.1 TRAP-type C4-dicarboxylate transport system, substrate-binding protein [Amphritea atlantica]